MSEGEWVRSNIIRGKWVFPALRNTVTGEVLLEKVVVDEMGRELLEQLMREKSVGNDDG